jgi:hypothetical protein
MAPVPDHRRMLEQHKQEDGNGSKESPTHFLESSHRASAANSQRKHILPPLSTSSAAHATAPKRLLPRVGTYDTSESAVRPVSYANREIPIVVVWEGVYRHATILGNNMRAVEQCFEQTFAEVKSKFEAEDVDFPDVIATDPHDGHSFHLKMFADLRKGMILELLVKQRKEDKSLQRFIQEGERKDICCMLLVLLSTLCVVAGCFFVFALYFASAAELVRYSERVLDYSTSASNRGSNLEVEFANQVVSSEKVNVRQTLLVSTGTAARYSSSLASVSALQDTDVFRVRSNTQVAALRGTFLSKGTLLTSTNAPLQLEGTSDDAFKTQIKLDLLSGHREIQVPDQSGTFLTTGNLDTIAVVGDLDNLTLNGPAILHKKAIFEKNTWIFAEGSSVNITTPVVHLGPLLGAGRIIITGNLTYTPPLSNYTVDIPNLLLGKDKSSRIHIRGLLTGSVLFRTNVSSNFVTELRPSSPATFNSILELPANTNGTLITTGNLGLINSLPISGYMRVTNLLRATNTFLSTSTLSLKGSVTFGNSNTDTFSASGSMLFAGPTTTLGDAVGDTFTGNGPTTFSGSSMDIGDAGTDTLTVNAFSLFHGPITIGSAASNTLTINSEIVGPLLLTGNAAGGGQLQLQTKIAAPTGAFTITLPDGVGGTLLTTGNLGVITSTGVLSSLTISGNLVLSGSDIRFGDAGADVMSVVSTPAIQSATISMSGALTVNSILATHSPVTLGASSASTLTVGASLLDGLIFTGSSVGGNTITLGLTVVTPTASTTINIPPTTGGTILADTNMPGLISGITVPAATISGYLTAGQIALSTDGTTPQSMVGYFNLQACPTGWSAYAPGQGRAVLSMGAGWNQGYTSGTAQTDMSIQTHTHQVTLGAATTAPEPNAHSHPVGGSSGTACYTFGGTTGPAAGHTHTATNNQQTHQHTFTYGAKTSAANDSEYPFIQLLVCQKNAN